MNKIIEEILKNEIPITMEYNKETQTIHYKIHGFYKSGEVNLYEKDGELIAESRYNQVDVISGLYDIVNLNNQWWISSQTRDNIWKNPESIWIPLLVKFDFIGVETNIVTTYTKK